MAQTTAPFRFEDATLNRVHTRHSGDGTNYRLLMRLWSTHRREPMADTPAERVPRCATQRGGAR